MANVKTLVAEKAASYVQAVTEARVRLQGAFEGLDEALVGGCCPFILRPLQAALAEAVDASIRASSEIQFLSRGGR